MIILSILCATTPDRSEMFRVLYSELQRQHTYMKTFHPTLGDIEILVDDSKRFLDGGLSIGSKMNGLIKRAQGKYLCRLDSDDNIGPHYLETLVRMCQYDNDIVTFRCMCKLDNFWMVVEMLLGANNTEAHPESFIERSPWPICPVKSVYAKMWDYPDQNWGEDWAWMEQVLSMCQTEAHSRAIIYEYRHSEKISEADKIIKAGYA